MVPMRLKLDPVPDPRLPVDMRSSGATWVVILTGREPPTTPASEQDRALMVTLGRALRLTAPEHVLVMLLDAHRAVWAPTLAPLPAGNLLSQAQSRGSAIALLQALVEIHCRDSEPRLVVMPSQIEVDDERLLMNAITTAQRIALTFPKDVILLGVATSRADVTREWIVPILGRPGHSHRVRSLVEDPSPAVACRLAGEGALRYSSIFACMGWALYDLFEDALPKVASAYLSGLARGEYGDDHRERIVGELPEHDFGRDVLRRRTERLQLVGM